MSPPRLTYCGNVHPATDVRSWLSMLEDYAVPVADRQRQAGHPFGLGTWWNAATAAELVQDAVSLGRVREALSARDLSIWTVNVFPHGSFHGEPVKTRVYQPDWSSEERVLFTRHVAEVVAQLGSELPEVALSTLPLGYREVGDEPTDEQKRLMARNLARAASHLHAMEQQHGVHMVLALEPEPFCLLETVAATAAFLEQWLFREGAWDTVTEPVLRRHLGVCVDLCHLAVVGEDPLAAMLDLRARGIAVPKVQVSSCLEVREPSADAALDRLLAFDEPVYLHQTVAAGGPRALDLPEVRARRAEFQAARRLRTHFHLPLFWDQEGPLGSTRNEVSRFLASLDRVAPVPLLEVETYTWGVLDGLAGPAGLRGQKLVDGLCRELSFARKPRIP